MQYTLLKQSHMILISRLVGLDAFITALYLLFRVLGTFLQVSIVNNSLLLGISIFGIVFFILITFVETIMSTWVVLTWANEEWEIKEGIIYHRRGVFNIHEEAYSLQQVGSVTLNQDWLGKICNYGTIRVFSPLLRQEYYLMNIHNPKEIIKLLEDEISGENQDRRSNIILKR